MEVLCSYSTTALLLQFNTCRRRSSNLQHRKRLLGMSVKAARRDSSERDYGGRLVDENMITLRMRIREMKMLETSTSSDDDLHQILPSDWMEWEKKHFFNYNKDVCEVLGLLQNYFLNTRPSLALGMLALVALIVPISTGVVLFSALQIAKGIFF
ncbi:hypothetical protein P3X46_016198 [Hevea brasiliensis]|uniref:Uncharacterized protein n=1 Tax=Hevea brasiliensis TaxID=3981 RepID=A0ABQ9M1Z2_HEVBR|nr:uncharacterized protein LOC110647061 [Hevea brasiliensis]KAJ9173020.1 hypothetical protein P3X46_016198 [Hevea brasiliensis]